MSHESDEFPMRINKYLARQGIATRRAADELIEKRQVFINGKMARLGDGVQESDAVEVKYGKSKPAAFAYYAFNKPKGLVTNRESDEEADVIRTLPKELQKLGLFPVGRLDKDSHGLLILTNDGRITDRLLNPKYEHEKTYEVKTKLQLRSSLKEKFESGIDIEGYLTKPAKVQILNEKRFRLTLTEGKTHQVRRMVVATFNEVTDLKRVSVMNVAIGNLPEGFARAIEGEELAAFLSNLNLLQSNSGSTS